MMLTDLIELARDAGREIMAVRAAGFESQQKLDGSIVTLADQRAEAIIEAGLAKLAPGVPVLAEEAGPVQAKSRLTPLSYWDDTPPTQARRIRF